jgi:hypothetical protein
MSHSMKTYLGESGLNQTFQEEFPATTSCMHCMEVAKIAFVLCEEGGLGERTDGEREKNPQLVCDLNKDYKGLWPHDCCAFAIYICPKCFGATTYFNQA